MNWCNKYIGLPYKLDGRTKQGIDCWGLVRLVYAEEFNIQLPSFEAEYANIQDAEAERETMAREGWVLSNDKNIGDVIVFNILGSAIHVGIYLGEDTFLHAREGSDSCIEKLNSPQWKNRIEGFYKYVPNAVVSARPHPLRTQRIDAIVPAGATLEQVAQIISKDISLELSDRSIILLEGRLVPKDQWATTFVSSGQHVEYRALPAGKSSTRMLAMLAVSIAVMAVMPAISASLMEAGFVAAGTGAGTGVAAALSTGGMVLASTISVGLNVAGMLLVNSIFPIRPPAEVTQAKSMVMIQGGQNKAEPYGNIPVVLGKFRYTPPLGAVAYSETSGRTSYLRMLVVWGYGPVQISDLKIGGTSIDNYEEVEYETLTGLDDTSQDSARFRSLYGKDVSQLTPNIKLESFQFSLTSLVRSSNVLSVTTSESHDFNSGDDVTLTIGYYDYASAEGFNAPVFIATGIITGEITVTGSTTFTISNVGIDETITPDGCFVKKSPWSTHTLTNEADSITVSLNFPSGLRKIYTDDRTGGTTSRATPFTGQIQVRQIDPDTMLPITNWGDIEKVFHSQSINLQPAWFNIDSDAELEPVYRWTRISINENNVLQVRNGAYTTGPNSNPSGTLLLRQQQDAFGLNSTYGLLPEYGQSEEPLWDICMYGNTVYSTVDKRAEGTAGVTGIGLSINELVATFASGEVTRAQTETIRYGNPGEPYSIRKNAFAANIKFNVPRGLHEVRVRRTNRSKTEFDNANHYHDCYLNTITGYSTQRPVISPKDVNLAMTAIRIKATNQLNGNIEGVTGTVQSICYDYTNRAASSAVRASNIVTITTAVAHKLSVGDSIHLHSMLDSTFDGKFKIIEVPSTTTFTYTQIGTDATSSGAKIWVLRPTRNPASLLRHVLQHPANAQKYTDEQIDLDGLVTWHNYCRTNKFMFDAVVTRSSVLDTLRDIGAAGRASPSMSDGKWGIIIDKPRTSAVQFFTPHNSWGFEGVRALVKLPHAFRVNFSNSERGYVPDEMLVYNDGYNISNATQIESIDLPGVTTRDAVFKHARFHLAQLKLRPEISTINVDIEHLICNRGDLVRVTHDVPMWGIGSGRISRLIPYVANTSGTKIVLSEPVPLDNTSSYVIRIRKQDGSSLTKSVRPVPSPIATVSSVASLSSLNYNNVSVDDRILVSENNLLLVVLPPASNDYLYNFSSIGGVKLGYANETVNIQALPSKETATTEEQAITMANDLSAISGYAQVAGTTGGSSYPVYWVTNSESGIVEGSLRWAIQQASGTFGGIVLFTPTGKFDIYLSSQIEIPSNITIDAPARNANIWAPSDVTRFKVVSNNVIIRRLQFGATTNAATATLRDSIWVEPSMADRVWINECSFQWSGDGCVDITSLVELTSDCRITVSNCYFNNHDKGSLIGSLACYQEDDHPAWCSTALSSQIIRLFVTMQQNFWNSVGQRQPKVVSQAFVDSINNVVKMAPYVRTTGDSGACYGLFTATGGMARSTNDLYSAAIGTGYSGIDASTDTYVPASTGVLAIEGKGAVDINGSIATNGVTLTEHEVASVITTPYSITPLTITNTTEGIIAFINTIESAAGASAKSPRFATSSINIPDGYYDTLELVTFSAGAYLPYNATNNNINPNDLVLFGLNNEESVELIVQSIEPSQNMTAKLTLVDYSPEVYDSDTEAIPAFDSNITLPPVLLAKTILTKPTIRQITSDESVMTIASPGQYIYNIKVSFTNPQTLPDNVIGVQGQIDFAEDTSLDWSSTITFRTEDKSVVFDDVQEGSQYKIRLRYVTDVGTFGPWTTVQTHTVVGKTTPPLQVSSITAVIENTKLRLDWPANPEIDVVEYEVRDTDSNWGEAGYVFKGKTSSCLLDSPSPGQATTYYIKAIDCTGLYSAAARAIEPFIADIVPNVSDIVYSFNDTSTTSATVTLSWGNVTPQYGLSKYEVSYGTTVIYTDSNSITLPANWVGDRYFSVVVIDTKGHRSTASIKPITKLAPYNVVAKLPKVVGTQVLLSWNQTINSTLPISGYEVRTTNSDWGSTGFLFKGSVTELYVDAPAAGVLGTWYIKAFDTDNVYSVDVVPMSLTPSNVYEINTTSIKEAFEDTSLTSSNVILTWDEVTPQFGLKNYTISYNITTESGTQTVIKNVSSNNVTLPADWLGDREFTFRVTDLNGNISIGVQKTINTRPPNPIVTIRSQVVDNTVLLYWVLPEKTTLPLQDVIIKKGPEWDSVETELIGSKKGEFTTIQELAAGNYTYWIAVRDTDNNISEPKSIGVRVSAPPDFVFYGVKQSSFNQTLNSAKLLNNSILLPVNTTESWQDHFTSRTWSSPQDQISAGYPLFIQPANNTGGYYEEVFNFEVTVPSTQITVDYSGSIVSGVPMVVITIETSENGTTWSEGIANNSIFASQFQYVRVRFSVSSADNKGLYELKSLSCRLDSKIKTDAGSATLASSDASGTYVNFNKEFLDVTSIILSPAGTTALSAVYDFQDALTTGTYSIVSNVLTVTATAHNLVPGQNVRLNFTSGSGVDDTYTVLSVVDANNFTVATTTADTTGNLQVYPQSFRAYLFDSAGTRVNGGVSWSVRGY